jgi:hypothetical protein
MPSKPEKDSHLASDIPNGGLVRVRVEAVKLPHCASQR